MPTPHFPESHHPLIEALSSHSDWDLLTLFKLYPEQGKYFTAIFCRYTPIIYTLTPHAARYMLHQPGATHSEVEPSPLQIDYLFALIWRYFYSEMHRLELPEGDEASSNSFSLQNWLIDMTAARVRQIELPSADSINYRLKAASPPLWCYLEQALDLLPSRMRLIVLMAQTFHWSETQIATYLQKTEKEKISPAEVQASIQQGDQMLEAALPEDIQTIYLGEAEKA